MTPMTPANKNGYTAAENTRLVELRAIIDKSMAKAAFNPSDIAKVLEEEHAIRMARKKRSAEAADA